MRLFRRCIATLACGCLLGTMAPSVYAKVAVIVARDSPISRLTAAQIADIYLGKLSVLPGVGVVIPVDQGEESSLRKQFYQKTTRKNDAQLNAYWARQVFTGKGEPPVQVGNDLDVKRLVASNPHAIGYIATSTLDASVKPVMILP